MSEAPKRIWLDWPDANKGAPVYDEPPQRETQPGQIGYIRKDVHASMIAALEADAASARSQVRKHAARIEADGKLIAEMREALTATCAALAASISLLEKGGRAAKKAAASDTMFNMMLNDYRRALSDARAILARLDAEAQPLQPHKYVPDPNPQMMGDCAVCGHIRSAAIHDAEAQR